MKIFADFLLFEIIYFMLWFSFWLKFDKKKKKIFVINKTINFNSFFCFFCFNYNWLFSFISFECLNLCCLLFAIIIEFKLHQSIYIVCQYLTWSNRHVFSDEIFFKKRQRITRHRCETLNFFIMSTNCHACDKCVKIHTELILHLQKCSILWNIVRRKILRVNDEKNDDEHVMKNDEKIAIDEMTTNESQWQNQNKWQIDIDLKKQIENYHSTFVLKHQSSLITRTIFTNTSNKIFTYENLTNKKTNHSWKNFLINSKQNIKQFSTDLNYNFFINSTNWTLTYWFWKTNCTKNVIDEFFFNVKLRSIYEFCSFNSTNFWMNKLHQIFHDIENDQWITKFFKMRIFYAKQKFKKYEIQFWNVINMIRFLLKYASFQKKFSYASIRQYNFDNK